MASRCNGQAVSSTECHVRWGVSVEDIWSVVDPKCQTVGPIETEVIVGRPEAVHCSWIFGNHLRIHEREGCVQALAPGIRVPGPGR